MLTVLPPSYTLTDESLQELLLSGSSSGETGGASSAASSSGAEACYLVFFSSTLPALPTSHTPAHAQSTGQGQGKVEKGGVLSESQLTSLKEALWCPDCRAALQAVLSVFLPGSLATTTNTGAASAFKGGSAQGAGSEPRALLLQVSREQWKDRTAGGHAYRKRHDVQSVPTILKWLGGKEVGRLVDEECADVDKVRALVHG